MEDNRRGWLLCPAAVLFAADVGLTLAGQPTAYWAGDYAATIEGNPVARSFLACSPVWFVVGAGVWLAMLSAVILWWPRQAGGWAVAVVVTVAHAAGGASWLARSGGWSWSFAVVYLVVAAESSWWCWRRAGRGRRIQRDT